MICIKKIIFSLVHKQNGIENFQRIDESKINFFSKKNQTAELADYKQKKIPTFESCVE
jgi:hypothetical protein